MSTKHTTRIFRSARAKRWTLLAAVLLLGLTSSAHAPMVVLARPVITLLARAWDDTNPRQNERAYCLTYEEIGTDAYRVVTATRATESDATPVSLNFVCPTGAGHTSLHTHPPTTCTIGPTGWLCILGGWAAHDWRPSLIDMKTLLAQHQPFAIIQYDRYGFRAYGPAVADTLP